MREALDVVTCMLPHQTAPPLQPDWDSVVVASGDPAPVTAPLEGSHAAGPT
jgi:hypothetical protein